MSTLSKITLDTVGTSLDRNFRNTVNDNFAKIANTLNLIIDNINESATSDSSKESSYATKQDISDLTSRINRIVIGTDNDTIKLIVEQILQEKGVI